MLKVWFVGIPFDQEEGKRKQIILELDRDVEEVIVRELADFIQRYHIMTLFGPFYYGDEAAKRVKQDIKQHISDPNAVSTFKRVE